MKTWKILRTIIVMAVAVLSFNSCGDDPDGKWSPMIWKAEMPAETTDGVYTASADGAEFSFSCENYSSPWIGEAWFNGEFFPPLEANGYRTVSTSWAKAEISGNKLKVVFEANETTERRQFYLTVTAGDIFYTFRFMQFENQ